MVIQPAVLGTDHPGLRPPLLSQEGKPIASGLAGILLTGLAALVVLAACGSREEAVHVAVAANFTEPAREIALLFEESTGHRTVLSFGATGQLYAQITQEAPFQIFLSADQETVARAVEAGLGVADTRFTYAIGRIVLYSTDMDLTEGAAVLREGSFGRIALANPVTAPYGAAAVEALQSLGLHEALSGKIVQGNNITQTFQFVETGNAELGFVAMSQAGGARAPFIWIVPDELYTPIRQDAVLLAPGAENPAARAFMQFLRSPEAVAVIENHGYYLP